LDFVNVKNGPVDLRVAVAGEGPLVLCVHGFPELWYSWRHQIAHFSGLGYKVAALDVRGYGGSSKPSEIAAYSIRNLASDVAAVIDQLGVERPFCSATIGALQSSGIRRCCTRARWSQSPA
jgi:pimeloyl-ACP methyl ester carboxylesterase